MDAFYERLIVAAATIDELLSEDFEPLPGQKIDTDRAARRLAAWCRACASGDWRQFARRLHRDGWDFPTVLERLASVRRTPSAPTPAWIQDAVWIQAALASTCPPPPPAGAAEPTEAVAFNHLLLPLAHAADARVWSCIDAHTASLCTDAARAGLRHGLLTQLSQLCAPPLYALFDTARPSGYQQFVTDMATQGFRHLFEAKPVLLRLISTIIRQWIDTTAELIVRLGADLSVIRADLLGADVPCHVTRIHGELGDLHNGGHSVHTVVFSDGTRIVYKPKDLRVDVAWHALIDRLNRAAAPVQLRAPRALAGQGYGWTEFIDHAGCTSQQAVERYFRRAAHGWALFFCFAAGDMHHENIIAAGDHPVPIDIETILQAAIDRPGADDPGSEAHQAAVKTIADSVMMVRLIPSYLRYHDNEVGAIGGLLSDWAADAGIRWTDINTDAMRPTRSQETNSTTPNLPHIAGHYAKFADHIDVFVTGFEDYARFLARWRAGATGLFDGFAGLPVRKVLRPPGSMPCCCSASRTPGAWMMVRRGPHRRISLPDCPIGTRTSIHNRHWCRQNGWRCWG